MLADIHKNKDVRNIEVGKIGVCDYKLPIQLVKKESNFSSIATISSYVILDKELKGAHLSRISEVITEHLADKPFELVKINDIVKAIVKRSETKGAELNIKFDYINSRLTPMSKKVSYLSSEVIVFCRICDEMVENSISIETVGTMLCPSSKAISEYSAHNQKCNLKVTLIGDVSDIELDEIVSIMEKQYSCPVYSTVKREDEKYITEKAYKNPKFSEDLIRDTLIAVSDYFKKGKIRVELVNNESIHQHNVYAMGEM